MSVATEAIRNDHATATTYMTWPTRLACWETFPHKASRMKPDHAFFDVARHTGHFDGRRQAKLSRW